MRYITSIYLPKNVLQCKDKYIGLQNENTCSCTKPSMRIGGCTTWNLSSSKEMYSSWIVFSKRTRNMAMMSIGERAQVIGMIHAGTSIRQVARLFNRRHFSSQNLWAKYVHTGSVEDLRRLPKRRVTTPLQDNHHLQDRFTMSSTPARNTDNYQHNQDNCA